MINNKDEDNSDAQDRDYWRFIGDLSNPRIP